MTDIDNRIKLKHNGVIPIDDIKRYFECPVCLCVPRNPPIFQCDKVRAKPSQQTWAQYSVWDSILKPHEASLLIITLKVGESMHVRVCIHPPGQVSLKLKLLEYF